MFKFSNKISRTTLSAAFAIGVAFVGVGLWSEAQKQQTLDVESKPVVIVPKLFPEAQKGEGVYRKNCATCHGDLLNGTNIGPPLLHKYYEPNHHSDQSIVFAITNGVRAHHWRFGDMPKMPGVKDNDIKAVIRYIRAMQEANGIY